VTRLLQSCCVLAGSLRGCAGTKEQTGDRTRDTSMLMTRTMHYATRPTIVNQLNLYDCLYSTSYTSLANPRMRHVALSQTF